MKHPNLGVHETGSSSSLEQPGELAWEAHIALSRGLELAASWPEAFYDVLEVMRVRSGTSPYVSLLRSVGKVEHWLAKLPANSGLAIRFAAGKFRARVQARRSDEDGDG